METLNQQIALYKQELKRGAIPKAYRSLLSYAKELKTYLEKNYPAYTFSSGIYQGQMDLTYFTCTPPELSKRKLKIALAFMHESIQWEIWLVGVNQKVQRTYSELFKNHGWNLSPLSPVGETVGSITEKTLVESPDYDNQEALTLSIEEGALQFIEEVKSFLRDK